MTEDQKLLDIRKANEDKRRREMPCPVCATAGPDREQDDDGMTCETCGGFFPWEMLYERDAWTRFCGHAKAIGEKCAAIENMAGKAVSMPDAWALLAKIEAEAKFMRWAWDGWNQMRNNLGHPVFGSVVGDGNPLFAADPSNAENEAAKRKERRDKAMQRHFASQRVGR